MTHGERQGLTVLATVLALLLAAIWWSNRPSGEENIPEIPAETLLADTATTATDTLPSPPPAAEKKTQKRKRPSREIPADRPSPLEKRMDGTTTAP